MSSADMETFFNALDAVIKDYTCGVCSELCKEPVILSKCFHIICAHHFDGLKNCSTCNSSLEGSTVYTDDRLQSCIDSAKELAKIFEGVKNKDDHTKPTKTSKQTTATAAKVSTEPELATKKPIIPEKSNESKPEPTTSNANNSLLSSVSRVSKALEKRNNKGETKLHIACRVGRIDIVTNLLNEGANTNTKDNAGWTPLHEVVQSGRLDLVKLLLQYNTLINVPGLSNETPLHEAIRYNHKEIAQELVKHGADMNARNCKGETPFQLASAKLKNILLTASDNVIQTQGVNIKHMSALYSELDFDDIRVYCVSKFPDVHNELKLFVKYHANLHIEPKFSKRVTHLIVDTDESGVCESSVEILQGVVNSIWILSSKWVKKSNKDKLESIEDYEVVGIGAKTYQGHKNARYNKYKLLPGIFDGCHFYLHNFSGKYEISKTIVVTKAILGKLITDAGGVVLRRVPNPESIPEDEQLVPYHARKGGKLVHCSHYIIFRNEYQPMYNMQHLKAFAIGWLIECIELYELCEPW